MKEKNKKDIMLSKCMLLKEQTGAKLLHNPSKVVIKKALQKDLLENDKGKCKEI